MKTVRYLAIAVAWVCAALPSSVLAFSLLGPYEPWMQNSNDFRLYSPFPYPGQPAISDIGGPMLLTNEYRWDVPIVTYGFDQSFLRYFGSNGVAAVNRAIQTLNDLPPASQIVSETYPSDTETNDSRSGALLDLQSAALSLLVEQLGLASPTRNAFVLLSWVPMENGEPSQFTVVQRNFDPDSFGVTNYIDSLSYDYNVVSAWPAADIAFAACYSLGSAAPFTELQLAVADNPLVPGTFYSGLTADDVGGLRYLYSSNNVNCETALSDVSADPPETNAFVHAAWRPGVEHVTFLAQSVDPSTGQFEPMTNEFVDAFVTNGAVARQKLRRVTQEPDILFLAGDPSVGAHPFAPVARTGTSNWINEASLSANPAGPGPGLIQPPIQIIFAKLGREMTAGIGINDQTLQWGSFDASTNAPIVYPAASSGTAQMNAHFLFGFNLTSWAADQVVDLQLSSQSGALFDLQTSTDLVQWADLYSVSQSGSNLTSTALSPITNNGSTLMFYQGSLSNAAQFFRLAPR